MRRSLLPWRSSLVVAALVGGGCLVDRAGLPGGASGDSGPGNATSSGAGGQGAGGQSASSSGSTGGGDPCSPPAACPQVPSACISLVDNHLAQKFTLRMADLKLSAPAVFTKGILGGVINSGLTMNLPSCNLAGEGTFSWLLQFDTTTGTVETGASKPADDPTQGYGFVNETIMVGGLPFVIAPFTAAAPIGADGSFAITMGQNLIMPVYLDLKAAAAVLLPLHAVRLSGALSADHDCIGRYNSKGLDPAGNCLADSQTPAFLGFDGTADGDGKIDGHISLEEADSIVIDSFGQSLCVVLSGDATTYGDGLMPIARCKRDANKQIIVPGDWCDATNDATCTDSLRFVAAFSASGVKAN